MVVRKIIKKIEENIFLKDMLRYEKTPEEAIEVAKVTGIKFIPEDLVKLKVKILELIDLPARMPEKVELEPLEEGILMKAYKTKIYLKRR